MNRILMGGLVVAGVGMAVLAMQSLQSEKPFASAVFIGGVIGCVGCIVSAEFVAKKERVR